MEFPKPVNHQQMLRLSKILALVRERERVTQVKLSKACECSTKSIQRDVAVLQANGWPIEYDKKGYFLKAQFIDDLESTENSQIASLVLAGCSVDKHLMDNFPAVAMSLKGSLFDAPDIQSIAVDKLSLAIVEERSSLNKKQLETFGAIARSIIEELAVEFEYRAVSKNNPITRTLFPISLRQKENVWYLVGYDLQREAVRVFTLNKIIKVRTYSEPFKKPSRKIVSEVLKSGRFSIWDSGSSKESQAIRVRLFEHAGEFVRNHVIHPSQSIEVIDEHSVILNLETSDLTGVNLWLRKFMHLVQVVEPKVLKDQFIQDLKESLRMNETSS